jgi:hypothetical protein
MNELLSMSYEQLSEIFNGLLPGGSDMFQSETGEGWTNLWFYRGRHGHIFLFVESMVALALIDKTFDREIINVDKNPELFDLYDWENKTLVKSEVMNFLDHKYSGGAMPMFADNAPLPVETTH